jgi:hypothetical protein
MPVSSGICTSKKTRSIPPSCTIVKCLNGVSGGFYQFQKRYFGDIIFQYVEGQGLIVNYKASDHGYKTKDNCTV